jgi:hypothetical protein
MNSIPSSEIVDAIYRLLPGFITAWIFYGLTAHPKASSFERVIQALIFTLFVESIVQAFTKLSGDAVFGKIDAELSLILKVAVALLLGLVFATMANCNLVQRWSPDWLTKRTSYPSEWYSAFCRNKSFVYLHLVDERRLYGWPEEWPDDVAKGHFVLMNAEWILPDNARVPLVITDRILIPAVDVRWVEFEKKDLSNPDYLPASRAATDQVLSYNSSIPNLIPVAEDTTNDAKPSGTQPSESSE